VITGKIGENACDLLLGAGISIRMSNSKGTVKDVLDATPLEETPAPDGS
jgi:predicted Fe-Mo cluster-binding NifX family protein